MASLALGVAGAVVGSYFGPMGAQVGWMVGSYLGGYLEGGAHNEGPRINDKSVQASTYGIPIPIIYGTTRVAGNIIWAEDLREVPNDSGGKGGPSTTETTYSYFGTFAVSLCANEITAVRKVWADGHLIYDASDGNSGPLGLTASQAWLAHVNVDDVAMPMLVYAGSETQMPDPTMEAYLGVGQVPAYRGQAYAVFTDFPLERFGNRIPNLSFEVVSVGTIHDPVTVYSSPANMRQAAVYNPLLNEVWQEMHQNTVPDDPIMVRLNADTGAVMGYVYALYDFTTFMGDPVYDAQTGSIFLIGGSTGGRKFARIDAASGVVIYEADFSGGAWPIQPFGPYLNPGTGDLWFFTSATHNAYEINKFNGSITKTVSFVYYFNAMVFDDYMGRGWLLLYSPSGDPNVAKTVWKLDEFGNAITASYVHTDTLDYIAYDSLRHVLILSTAGNGTIIEYDVIAETVAGITYTLPDVPTAISYDPQRDLVLATNWASGKFFPVFAGTGEPYKDITTITGAGTNPAISGRNAVFMSGGATSGLSDWSLVKVRFDMVTSDTVLLSDIVEDLCVRTGLLTTDVDVTELIDEVLGYAVTRQGPCRDNVQQLATGFLFDGVESDDVIKFHKRGRSSAITIPADDCAAHAPGAGVPDVLTKTRAQDIELPQRLTVIYNAIALDYAQGAQLSERLAGPAPESGQLQSFESPIVMSDDYARSLADVLMFNAWTERTRYEFATSLKYAAYEPTDVVTVIDRVLRITRKHEAAGLVRFEGVEDDLAIYAQDAEGVSAIRTPQTITALVPSFFTPIDCALLRDVDNAPGFYAAVGGYTAGWQGAVLYKSFDGGASYVQVQAFTNQPARGVATNALGDFFSGNIYDEINALTVTMWAGSTLSSSTRTAVNNGANAAALQSGDLWEIVQFRDATLNANGTYTLRGLLRGRLGSEYAMSGHAAGDAFVLLTPPTLGDIPMAVAEIDAERLYKPVTIRDSLANTMAVPFTAECVRLMPLAPVHLGGGRNASSDLIGTWRRRSRMGWGWHNGADIQLGEDSELYDVVIYTDNSYATVKRTFSSLTSETFTYTAAQQTSDFGAPQSTVYGDVYQISATVGRGFAARFAF